MVRQPDSSPPYDEEQKKSFLKKLPDLYEAHMDFLSNPLLAYMMLVTFAFNPEIPNRMFQFYEYAFEALYHRHDLTKGYKRRFHCDLEKQDFIRLISFFCLKTCYDQDYEFTGELIRKNLDDVKKIEQIDANTETFLKDMIESVCIIKVEGLTYTFTHRSIQEYFAAYCIARVAVRSAEKIFAEFANRFNDSVMAMVYDIHADLLREKYIIPCARRYSSFVNRKSNRRLYESFADKIGAVFTIKILERQSQRPRAVGRRKVREGDEYHISLSCRGEMQSFYDLIKKLSEPRSLNIDEREARRRADDDFVVALRRKYGAHVPLEFMILVENGELTVKASQVRDSHPLVPVTIDVPSCVEEFRKTGMYQYLCNEAELFIERVRREEEAYKNVGTAFESLF